jgi:hypothetical protein
MPQGKIVIFTFFKIKLLISPMSLNWVLLIYEIVNNDFLFFYSSQSAVRIRGVFEMVLSDFF